MNRICLSHLLLVAALAADLASATSASIIRVKWDSPNNGPGYEWAHAYRTVTAAVAAAVAGDEIWVAGDSSHPYTGRFTLKVGVALYGGFGGTEITRAERNWKARATTLQGDGNYLGGYPVVTITDLATRATVLDGFTITDGTIGVCSVYSSASVTNNTITANKLGIRCEFEAPFIAHNLVHGNTRWGIGCNGPSTPTVVGNIIWGNPEGGLGCSWYCTPSITNNTIIANGTGISIEECEPLIRNNIVAFNARGVERKSGTPALSNNCVFNPGGTSYLGLQPGSGDISDDPLFVNRATEDFHLSHVSPCIDAGLDAAVNAEWTDMDDRPRVFSAHVDIGADEYRPPSIPMVTDDGVHTTSLAQLHATWISFDPVDGIAEYQYAIGTSPVDPSDGYTVSWKSAGTATEATEIGPTLAPGRVYYWYVKAKSGSGRWSDSIGVSDGIVAAPVLPHLADARQLTPESAFTVDRLVAASASSDFPGYVFLQDPGRACGIRVNTTAAFNRGDRANVVGRAKRVDGEWQIDPLDFPGVVAGPEPAPLHLTQRSLAYDLNEDLAPDNGLDPTGLLVTVAGRITRVNTTFHVLYIDDGAGLADGMGPSDYPYVGLRVSYRTFVPPAVGKRVAITGILRVEKTTLEEDAFVNGEYRRAGETLYLPVVWPRTAADIVVLF